MVYRKNKGKKIAIKILSIFLLLSFIILLIDYRVRPVIKSAASHQLQIIGNRVVATAVNTKIEELRVNYENIVDIKRDSVGQVVSLETNMFNLNKIKSTVMSEVLKNISSLENQKVKIPLGAFVGIHSLATLKPEFEFNVLPMGSVKSELISTFDSAGINQTRHRIVLNINVQLSTIIPFYKQLLEVQSTFNLAETIIVGKVPDTYTKVISSDEELISKINDYGPQTNSK